MSIPVNATEFHSQARLSDQEAARHCGMKTGLFITAAMKVPTALIPVMFRDRRWWTVPELTAWLATLGKHPVPREDWPEPEEAIHTKIVPRVLTDTNVDKTIRKEFGFRR